MRARNTLCRTLLAAALAPMLVLSAVAPFARAAEQEGPIVAAAANLRFALPEIAERFQQRSGREVRLVFGASGSFRRQIAAGAPYQIFLSADESYVLALAEEGRTRGRGRIYAVGRLALLVPVGSPLVADGTLADLAAAVADGRLRRFAIANPDHAPYGRAARAVLRHADLWPRIRPRLVLGENVAQAAQYAISGSAEGGIVAYALAWAPRLRARAAVAPIPAGWHPPLRQRMVLLKTAGPVAEAFYAFLSGTEARSVLRRFGFLVPTESARPGE